MELGGGGLDTRKTIDVGRVKKDVTTSLTRKDVSCRSRRRIKDLWRREVVSCRHEDNWEVKGLFS